MPEDISQSRSGKGLAALVDTVLPGRGSGLDRLSRSAQQVLQQAVERPARRAAVEFLRGNRWLGHPAHPLVIAVPVGAWVVSGWYDARSAATGRRADEDAADAALRVGLAGAVLAAVTGMVQYLDTRGAARRETAVHAGLNGTALTLYTASWAARASGRRQLGRRLAGAGLGVVALSGYLGGDLSYRQGVGVRPQVLRDPDGPASASDGEPLGGPDARYA